MWLLQAKHSAEERKTLPQIDEHFLCAMVLDREIFNELKNVLFAVEHATEKFLIHFIAHTYGNAGFSLSRMILFFV